MHLAILATFFNSLLGAVLVSSRAFFFAVKWIGAAYLVHLGLSALLGRSSPITASSPAARALT